MKLVAAMLMLCSAITSHALLSDDPTASITAEIVQARDYATSYVALAKNALAKSPTDLLQAQKLYALAYANNNAWVAYVKTALQDGKAKNLGDDKHYQAVASSASSAGTKFIAFVDSKTGESKAVNALLSSLGALGLQLWNGVKDREQKDRTTAATNFEQEAKWPPWEGSPSVAEPKPSVSTSPKP